jgi:hypothetical protein
VSITDFLIEDTTIVAPVFVAGARNDLVADWDNATRTAAKAWIAQATRSEVTDGRDALVQTFIATYAAGTVIDGRCRVEWGDLTLEVIGPPNRPKTPDGGGEHHVTATLRAVDG